MAAQPTPIFLLTGFLGSGKTTTLNHWLRQPEFGDVAVIVNEFGEVGIDNELIERGDEDTIELSTGCICCTVRGTLAETLQDLDQRRLRGEIKRFNAVVIETTGLADPAPVIQALMTTPVVGPYRLAKVVTTVEAPQGLGTLERHGESVKQVAVADDVIVTKTDLAPEGHGDLTARIASINPGAAIHEAKLGRVPSIETIGGGSGYDPRLRPEEVRTWLAAESIESLAHGHDHRHHDVNRHSATIGSFVLSYDEPLEWEAVAHWLDALIIAHGEQMLRIKGVLSIAGRDEPIVVQAVQKLFHPPTALARWPDGERRSRIVFITDGIAEDFVREVFEVIRGAARNRATSAPNRQKHIGEMS